MERSSNLFPGDSYAGASDEDDGPLASWLADTLYPAGVAFTGESTAGFVSSNEFETLNSYDFSNATFGGDFSDGETFAAPSRVPQHRNSSRDSMLTTVMQDGQTSSQQYLEDGSRYMQEPEDLRMIPIPQEPYVTRRKQSTFERLPSIDFRVNGAGVPLRDVLNNPESLPPEWANDFRTLPGLDRQKIQLRLNWPGYRAQFMSLNVKNFEKNTRSISKLQLLERVAKSIKDMMTRSESYRSGSEGLWSIDKNSFDSIKLLSLRHVSEASWQPELCF